MSEIINQHIPGFLYLDKGVGGYSLILDRATLWLTDSTKFGRGVIFISDLTKKIVSLKKSHSSIKPLPLEWNTLYFIEHSEQKKNGKLEEHTNREMSWEIDFRILQSGSLLEA